MEIVTYHQRYEQEVVDLWNQTLTADPVTVQKFRKQALFDDTLIRSFVMQQWIRIR